MDKIEHKCNNCANWATECSVPFCAVTGRNTYPTHECDAKRFAIRTDEDDLPSFQKNTRRKRWK